MGIDKLKAQILLELPDLTTVQQFKLCQKTVIFKKFPTCSIRIINTFQVQCHIHVYLWRTLWVVLGFTKDLRAIVLKHEYPYYKQTNNRMALSVNKENSLLSNNFWCEICKEKLSYVKKTILTTHRIVGVAEYTSESIREIRSTICIN